MMRYDHMVEKLHPSFVACLILLMMVMHSLVP